MELKFSALYCCPCRTNRFHPAPSIAISSPFLELFQPLISFVPPFRFAATSPLCIPLNESW